MTSVQLRDLLRAHSEAATRALQRAADSARAGDLDALRGALEELRLEAFATGLITGDLCRLALH